MKRVPPLATSLSLVALAFSAFAVAMPGSARADDLYAPAPAPAPAPSSSGAGSSTGSSALVTWGGRGGPFVDATSVSRDAPVTRAREMLTRARFLDEAALVDEKAATELSARIGSLRTAAKAARDHADKASPEDRELLGARADDLETDVVVSEAEITFRRRTAADNRRVARELRLRAVKVVREAPTAEVYDPTANACDPPFRFTADARKVYRVECLK